MSPRLVVPLTISFSALIIHNQEKSKQSRIKKIEIQTTLPLTGSIPYKMEISIILKLYDKASPFFFIRPTLNCLIQS